MATEDSIPVVDFKDVFSSQDLASCPQVKQLHSAFTKVGFVFIKNHGIQRKLIDDAFQTAVDFFHLPLEVKKSCIYRIRENKTRSGGYVAMEQESVNPSMPGDLKECFQVSNIEDATFPDKALPNFKAVVFDLYKSSIALANTILEAMGYALQLDDPLFFMKNHQNAGRSGNCTTARLLYYPPILSPESIKPGQLRCGEHVDYGSITLLFQDPQGGLQVKKCHGGYIDVPYMQDAVLVNLGALMQKWTGDKYLATPHRVLVPDDESKQRKARQSIAIFVHPDDDTLVQCIDGSDKYPPITAYQDTYKRLFDSYDKSFFQ